MRSRRCLEKAGLVCDIMVSGWLGIGYGDVGLSRRRMKSAGEDKMRCFVLENAIGSRGALPRLRGRGERSD
jgi:hypothetical protein